MCELTERQVAEIKINAIKEAVANTGVDYFFCESPFKISLHLKKKFLVDYSPKSLSKPNVSQAQSQATPANSRSPWSMSSNSSSVSSFFPTNDSGINVKSCESCEVIEKDRNDVKKELVKTILETKETVHHLKSEQERKDMIIKNLEKELKETQEEKDRFKVEKNMKNEQLKQKNKALEKSQSNYGKLNIENENCKTNFTNKISNLECTIKNLHAKLDEKKDEIKREKIKVKKIESKKKCASKATETNGSVKEESTQTSRTENKEVGTLPLFTKIHLLGEPNHEISCFCLCHNQNARPHYNDSPGEKCEVQVFQFTKDPEEALDSIYYRDIFDFSRSTTDDEDEIEDEDEDETEDEDDTKDRDAEDETEDGGSIMPICAKFKCGQAQSVEKSKEGDDQGDAGNTSF